MLIIKVPFLRITIDIVGPLPKSSAGHQYLLVIVDYATRFLEAVPMWLVIGPRGAEELMKWITQVGIPKETVTDQGPNFMSGVIHGLCRLLRIKHLHKIVYCPQTNRVAKRFN